MFLEHSALHYLEDSAARLPRKTAVVDARMSLEYQELVDKSRRVGSSLIREGARGHAVVIIMEKSCDTVCAMMGALYAGASYVPVDLNVPVERLHHILQKLPSSLLVGDTLESLKSLVPADHEGKMFAFAELEGSEIDEEALAQAREHTLETDPAYLLFTSGSTGVPKGVAISHRAICSFIDAFVPALGIREDDRLANQAPFDFDVSTKDIYSTFAVGATLVIVPRPLFMQPAALVTYLAENDITVLVWAVAALCIMSTYHALDGEALGQVRIVAFSGEVMPPKHLKAWRATLPEADFFNLYGPTEITCNCTYHHLDPQRDYSHGIPLGKPFAHCGVLLIDKDGREVREAGAEGEIVVRGPSVALGYVGMPEQTAAAFGQNPLNHLVTDRVYHTGDVATYSTDGELFFRGRKDNQVKYMGHRIELEEIDLAIGRMKGVDRCVCVFDNERKRLHAFYEGEASEEEIRAYVTGTLPQHMRPTTLRKLDTMALTKNGKVDRAQLLALCSRKRRRTKVA
ncbi:MAG: amino acid adenylation domain-containing protein [Coriobacteriales bacterium]|nr:amino acid adenylation domain-containing protein [Coriobacteriales bacterium]